MILEQGRTHGFNMKVRQVALFLENEVNLETEKMAPQFLRPYNKI